MRNILLIIALYLSGCNSSYSEQSTTQVAGHSDTILKHDTIYVSNKDQDWQEGFGLTHNMERDSVWGKPISYYVYDPNCAGLAIDFYEGNFRPTDSKATSDLLSLAYTDNQKLRPFYRWCLNKTILIQDGALAEYTGNPARRYAEKFPKEFFEYMDSDTSGSKYSDWVESIIYCGLSDFENYKKPHFTKENLISTMKRNCQGCNATLINRIEKFGAACFAEKK